MKAFIIAVVGCAMLCCYGIEGALLKADEWGARMSKAAERAMRKIDARHAAERERWRAEDAARPRLSDRKLVRRRPYPAPEAQPVPMEERYEQR